MLAQKHAAAKFEKPVDEPETDTGQPRYVGRTQKQMLASPARVANDCGRQWLLTSTIKFGSH